MTRTVCPTCKNTVVYDQGKSIPKCPVCQNKIEPGSGQKMITIKCPTCKTSYQMAEGTEQYQCPLCDSTIDVRKERASYLANQGATSIIRYQPDGNDWLIYKHPIEDFPIGTQLIVEEGQQALLVQGGEASDMFPPQTYILDTQYLPMMEKYYKLSSGDTRGGFQSSIYFFNTRIITANASGKSLRWFVKKVPVLFSMSFEGLESEMSVPFNIGCNGTYHIQITNARKLFLKLNLAASGLNAETIKEKRYSHDSAALTDTIKNYFNSKGGEILPRVLSEKKVTIYQLDQKRSLIAEEILSDVNEGLDEFGLKLSNFLLQSFVTPKDDDTDPGHQDFINLYTASTRAASSFRKENLRAQMEQVYRNTQQEKLKTAQTELGFETIEAQRQIIRANAEAEAMRLSGMAEAAVMKEKGYNQKDVLQADVQKAMAAGIGQMGANGGGSGGSGLMGDLIGLSAGIAAAGTMMPQISNMMQGFGVQQSQYSSTPTSTVNIDIWECSCGEKGISRNFCPNCGAKRPEKQNSDTWECSCGEKGISRNFCPNCGTKRPEKQNFDTWECSCGEKGISRNFCPNCGNKRPEKLAVDVWKCSCGEKEISKNFCPNCGSKRPEKTVLDVWECSCGEKEISKNFCPNCGSKRPE